MTKPTTAPTAGGSSKENVRGVSAGGIDKPGKNKSVNVYLPTTPGHCTGCHAQLDSTSQTAKLCNNCGDKNIRPNQNVVEMNEEEVVDIILDIPTSQEDLISTIASLRAQVACLQKITTEQEQVINDLKIRLADKILGIPVPQKTYAQALGGYIRTAVNTPPKANHTIILENIDNTAKTRLTAIEVNAVRRKLEAALENKKTINASKLRSTPMGKIAIDFENEADKVTAVNQINRVTVHTGYSARAISKKFPRMMLKNIEIDYLPTDLQAAILDEYPELKELVESDQHRHQIKTIVILKNEIRQQASVVLEVSPEICKILSTYGKIRLGMCVYAIENHIRVAQCFKCMKAGHTEKYCRSPKQACGICSGEHTTRECQHFHLKKDPSGYAKLDKKNCSNCDGHRIHSPQASTHGSSDKSLCPYYKDQLTQYRLQIDYGH